MNRPIIAATLAIKKSVLNHVQTSGLTSRCEAGLVVATTLGTVLLHFEFFPLAGYPVTVAPALVPLVLAVSISTRRLKALLAIPVVVAGYALLVFAVAHGTSFTHFLRTLALVLFTVGALGAAALCALRGDGRWLNTTAKLTLWIVVLYSVAQATLYFVTGNPTLYNPWRAHQYLYQYATALQSAVIRAPGFYLEPSFNAFVMTALLSVLIARRTVRVPDLIFGAIGLVSTKSVSGLLLGVVLYLWLAGSGYFKRIGWRATIIVVAIVLTSLALNFSYVSTRLASLSVNGSSIHYRLAAPVPLVRHVLSTSPLGEPLGSVSDAMRSYGFLNGTASGTSLDNGVYLIIYYFGWAGVLLLVAGATGLLLRLVVAWKAPTTLVMIFLLGSLNFSGGIFLPEYVYMLVLVILAGRFPVEAIPRQPMARSVGMGSTEAGQ